MAVSYRIRSGAIVEDRACISTSWRCCGSSPGGVRRMTPIDALQALARGERPVWNIAFFPLAGWKDLGSQAYGEEAIVSQFRQVPFEGRTLRDCISSSGHAAMFAGQSALFADVYDSTSCASGGLDPERRAMHQNLRSAFVPFGYRPFAEHAGMWRCDVRTIRNSPLSKRLLPFATSVTALRMTGRRRTAPRTGEPARSCSISNGTTGAALFAYRVRPERAA